MVLQSQRFTGVSTLERCITKGYRLMAGDPDSVAITESGDQLEGGRQLPPTHRPRSFRPASSAQHSPGVDTPKGGDLQ